MEDPSESPLGGSASNVDDRPEIDVSVTYLPDGWMCSTALETSTGGPGEVDPQAIVERSRYVKPCEDSEISSSWG